MSQVARIARFRIDPNHREDLWAAYREYEQAVRSEEGMCVWEMATDADDDVVWLFVRAEDAASLEAHRSSEASAQLGEVLGPAIVGSPEFHDLVPHFTNRP